MVTMAPRNSETSANQNLVHHNHENGGTQNTSGYEKCREERIKENMERMQKLGILDLSLKLKSNTKSKINKNNPYIRKTPPPLRLSGPVRRSSRLGNTTPVSYSEVTLSKKGSFEMEELLSDDGSRPEVYTKEQENLLGDTSRSWTLFVDGYDRNGKRIYDPVNGKTCHQCRQKTLGHHTHCSECNRNRGQFCGDCLYMRYGENVIEAIQNPEWVCPVCRGICNCSFCRQAKGWAPTGIMYNKVSKMGYKSVAHYLIQTQCPTNDSKTEDSKVPVSAKRSLAFTTMEATPSIKESGDSNIDLKESVEVEVEKEPGDSNFTPESIANDRGSLMPESKEEKAGGELEDNKEDTILHSISQHGETNIYPESIASDQGSLMPESKDEKAGGELEDKKEDTIIQLYIQHGETNIYPETCPESRKGPSKGKEHIDENVAPKTRPDPTETLKLTSKSNDNVVTSEEESVQILDSCDSIVGKKNSTGSKKTPKHCEPMPDSIGSRLRSRKTNKENNVQILDSKHCDSIGGSMTGSKKKTHARCEPVPDSIGARLRQRRRIC